MSAQFSNVYDDRIRAGAYARLEYPGTYYLAFRDIPAIVAEHVQGKTALDFGCGTGRSTRFLRQLGFDVVGASRTSCGPTRRTARSIGRPASCRSQRTGPLRDRTSRTRG